MNIKNVELVSIEVTNAAITKYPFPLAENIAGKKITAIEAFKVDDIAVNEFGKTVISNNAFKDCFVTLNVNGKEVIKTLPLAALHPGTTNKVLKRFDGIVLNAQKSYVEFGQATNLVAGNVIVFAFYFD